MHRIPQQYHREVWKITVVSALTIVLSTFAILVRQTNQSLSLSSIPPEQHIQEKPAVTANSAILYRRLEDDSWHIHAVNADGSADTTIARLPGTATDIHWIDESHLLYVDADLPPRDARILLRDITDQTDRTLIQTADTVSHSILSPDRRWIAYRQASAGVFIAALDSFPAVPKAITIADAALSDRLIPLFFDHLGRLYVSSEQPAADSPPLFYQISVVDNPPVVKRFTGKAPCLTLPVISPVRDLLACIGTQANRPGATGIYLMNITTGEMKLLLTPAAPSYAFTNILWHDDGRQLAAEAMPVGKTSLFDHLIVTIDPDREQLTILESDPPMPALDLLGYTADGVIAGPARLGSGASSFFIHDGDSITTIPVANAHFISTLPGIVPQQ